MDERARRRFSVHFTGYFKNEKKENESKRGGIGQQFISLPQVVVAFAKKSPARFSARKSQIQ